MDKLSDEELVGYTFQYCIPFGDGSLGNPRADLLSHLAKGRKAIQAMETIRQHIPLGDRLVPLTSIYDIVDIFKAYDKE